MASRIIYGRRKSEPTIGEGVVMHVERWNPVKDGIFSEKAFRRKLENKGYQVTRFVYQRGSYFPEHTHNVDRIEAVVSGHFRLVTSENQVNLGAGDFVLLLRGTTHSAEVIGDEPVVILDAAKT